MKGKKMQETIARERILHLFAEARKRFFEDRSLAKRYVMLARKIAMKVRVHMPREVKRSYCKSCHAYLYPPHNVRVRLQKNHVSRTCLECGRTMRFPYVREHKAKRHKSI